MGEMDRAYLEIPKPGSCKECLIAFMHTVDDVENNIDIDVIGCGYTNIDVTEYTDRRHSECPLELVYSGSAAAMSTFTLVKDEIYKAIADYKAKNPDISSVNDPNYKPFTDGVRHGYTSGLHNAISIVLRLIEESYKNNTSA
jgi:hypothetical protein